MRRTPVSALLHSACYVKAGVYLVARMYSLAPWNHALGGPMLVIGCLTMIVGALFALVQTDLKRLLAFSTISQLGHIVTLLSLGTNLAIAAALFYTVNHGIFKGTLFLCAGAVQQATGTRDMRMMGGLSSTMPATTRVWLIAAASIVGVPLTNGFVAKWLLFNSALEAGQIAVVMVALVVSILTAFYMLKATSSVFYGNIPDGLRNAKIKKAPLSMRSGMAALGVLCLVFGIAPQLLMQTVVGPAVRSLGFEWNAPVSWLGLLTGTADPHVTVGAIIVLAALLLGFIIYRITRPRIRKTVMVFTGGDQPQADHGVGAADFSEMAGAAFKPLYRVNPDPAYVALWRGVKAPGWRCSAPRRPRWRGILSWRQGCSRSPRSSWSGSCEASMDMILVGFFGVVFLAVALYSIRVRQGGWRWWALAAIVTLLVVGSRLSESAWPRLLLLEASAFAAAGLVWVTGTPAASRAARLYLWLLIPAVGCSLAGFALAGGGAAQFFRLPGSQQDF